MVLFSCEDNTAPLVPENRFFPLAIGNYWIYTSYERDSYYKIISSTITEDSVVIENSETILGVNAFYFVRYRSGEPIDTMIFANNKNYVYRLHDSANTLIPALKNTWFPVADFVMEMNGTWNVFKRQMSGYPYSFEGGLYPATWFHTINGEYDYSDTADINGKDFLTKRYSNKYDSKLDFSYPRKNIKPDGKFYYDTLKVTQLLKYFEKYQFAEGIGIYKMYREPHSIVISTEPSSTFSNTQYVNGVEMILKRYKLK